MRPIFICLSLSLLLTPSLQTQEKPETFFYIISVPPPEGFTPLPSLKERADALKTFISETYNPDGDHLYVLESEDETKAAEIRRILYSKIPNHPADSLIFFFLLTHAEVEPYRNTSSRARADLQIVASDTKKENLAGTSIHGLELLASFVHAPLRSQIFAFIDSCKSGSLETPFSKSLVSLSNLLGSRMYVLTSSAAGESSYAGYFTQALIDVWRNQGAKCINKSYFINSINEKLASRSQRVQEIIPFDGPCLNFANQGVGLVVVWNTGEGSIYLELPDGARSDLIDADESQPTLVPLPRNVEVVSVFKSDHNLLGVLELDFSTSPVTLYSVKKEKNPMRVVHQYLKTADRTEDFGFVQEAQTFKAFAAGFASESGDKTYARTIEASIDRSAASKELLAALDYYQTAHSAEGADQKVVGDLLASLGKFQAAYAFYIREFESGNSSPEVFGGLYTSLVLAKRKEAAQEVREQFPLLFSQSEEAKETKELLNDPDADNFAAVAHGMESAASRTGLVVPPDAAQVMVVPP